MGKSTAAKMMSKLGAPVHSADKAVHKALSKEGSAIKPVSKTFPETVQHNAINKKLLGQIVFFSPAKLKRLEKILHPLVEKSQTLFINQAIKQKKKAVVLEIPLLFETNAQKRCDLTVCVTAPYKIQYARVLKRKGMTPKTFKSIIKKQMPNKEKCRKADYIIQTGIGIADTNRQIKIMWNKLIKDGKLK